MTTAVQAYSPRITGAELPRNGKPLLIVSYTVQGKGDGDYQAVLQGEKPFVETDWLRQNGTITPEMLKLLVPKNAVGPLNAGNIYVWTDPNHNYSEGLRMLRWDFRDRGRPFLYSNREPEGRGSIWGVLLGSVAEGGGRLKIDGVDYYVQPEITLRGKNLWEMRVYAQDNGMIHSLSPAVNAAARFTRAEDPDKGWVRSEVERFEKNRTDLKEVHVEDMYRQLRDCIWKSSVVIAGEMLAWPIMLSQEP
ncbi:MAG: hypothetical protein HYW23_03085 [Candidatus Aenigmarchaeota archaeon]|nr:hypothetical protein [Candidatus Aenigmarchaeota archaeon]